MSFSAQTILQALPHRYPFLFVDQIVEHKFKEMALCKKNVTHGEEVFQGHFPGNPIFPGVLMIEMGLQATQIMLTDLSTLSSTTESKGKAIQGYVLAVDKFKFKEVVKPGDVLFTKAEIDVVASGLARARIEIQNQNQVAVASGTVTVTAAN